MPPLNDRWYKSGAGGLRFDDGDAQALERRRCSGVNLWLCMPLHNPFTVVRRRGHRTAARILCPSQRKRVGWWRLMIVFQAGPWRRGTRHPPSRGMDSVGPPAWPADRRHCPPRHHRPGGRHRGQTVREMRRDKSQWGRGRIGRRVTDRHRCVGPWEIWDTFRHWAPMGFRGFFGSLLPKNPDVLLRFRIWSKPPPCRRP